MNQDLKNYQQKSNHTLAFAIMSVIGVFMFMVPLPREDGAFNIPLGFVIEWLGLGLNSIEVNGYGLLFLLALIVITISFIGSVLAYALRPAFIMESEMLKNLFLCHPVYFISKLIAVVACWMVFLGVGPDWLIGEWVGAWMMMDLIAGGGSGSNLMSIFIILGIAIPILTESGVMEFFGILIKKIVRLLFTLPGRSSIDLISSWFSSSAASVIITRDQHERGFYTDREAAAICVNFTLVSLPFTFVVANAVGLAGYFFQFYLVICIASILLAVIMPRIWPLRGIRDDYMPEVGKQIVEEVPEGTSMFGWAVMIASKRASENTPGSIIKSGLSNWLNIFMDLIPVILAWGTVALIINDNTPVFDWLSLPFAHYLNLLQVPYAFEYAPATIVGFVDMYVPALILGTEAPFKTRFVLGTLSIVQIIYMAETGILILKSKIPLNIGHLAILFIMRTVLSLPVIVVLTHLLF